MGHLFDQICNDDFRPKPGALDQFEQTNKWPGPEIEPTASL